MRSSSVLLSGLLVLSGMVASCSTQQKTEVTEAAMNDRGRRHEIMEATLRVLDEHPAYVDEFFALTRKHPRTRDRFFAATAAALDEGVIAERVARYLVAHPRGLRHVMIETLEAARRRPAARRAIAEAMEARAHIAADVLVDHPAELAAVSKALVEQALENPDTKDKMKDLVKELVTE